MPHELLPVLWAFLGAFVLRALDWARETLHARRTEQKAASAEGLRRNEKRVEDLEGAFNELRTGVADVREHVAGIEGILDAIGDQLGWDRLPSRPRGFTGRRPRF